MLSGGCARRLRVVESVVLADGEPAVRSALRLLLDNESELGVVGEVGDAVALLAQAVRLVPHVILLDWHLPGMTPARLVAALHLSAPGARIVAMSSRPEERSAALAAGVDAFVSKGDAPEHLLSAIRALIAAS